MILTFDFWLLTLETIIWPSNFDNARRICSISSPYARAAIDGPFPDILAARAPFSSAAITGVYLDESAAEARTPLSFMAFQYWPASASLKASMKMSDKLLSLRTSPLVLLRGKKMITLRFSGAF